MAVVVPGPTEGIGLSAAPQAAAEAAAVQLNGDGVPAPTNLQEVEAGAAEDVDARGGEAIRGTPSQSAVGDHQHLDEDDDGAEADDDVTPRVDRRRERLSSAARASTHIDEVGSTDGTTTARPVALTEEELSLVRSMAASTMSSTAAAGSSSATVMVDRMYQLNGYARLLFFVCLLCTYTLRAYYSAIKLQWELMRCQASQSRTAGPVRYMCVCVAGWLWTPTCTV